MYRHLAPSNIVILLILPVTNAARMVHLFLFPPYTPTLFQYAHLLVLACCRML